MQMDKRTILAIFLIVIIMLLTPYYMDFMGLNKKPIVESADSLMVDTMDFRNRSSIKTIEPEKNEAINQKQEIEKENIFDSNIDKDTNIAFQNYDEEVIYKISTPLLNIEISNKMGGSLKKWELKEYAHFENDYVNLIDDNYFNFSFIGEDGVKINTSDVIAFPVNNIKMNQFDLYENDKPFEISFLLKTIEGGSIKRTFILYPNNYHVDIVQDFENMSNKFHGNYYDYQWNNGIPLVEENKEDEISYNGSNVYMGEELEYIDADDEDIKFDSNGNIDWTSVRNKYFSIYLKAKNVNKTEGVLVESPAKKESDIIEKNYFNNTIIFENSRLNQYQDSLTVYLGPLDYGILKYYECEFQELVMNRNWYEKFTRPIALVMIPIFSFLYKYIGNYGFVIIVFSILLKLLLYPLTKKSYQSMKEMALLQPIIGELREKYKDNPQKMNKELMGIYKKHGVNPMGGCLPNLLQMPILFAMFSLFRSTIQLRGQEFIFWIKDLSAPDVIPLGFSLPYIGDTFHLLPILSSVTMIFQSKQTTTDPKNKALVYMMPVMMLVFLYSFPSGLHLYYFVFNIFSFLQQKMIKEPVPLNEREKEKIKKIKHKK